MNNYGTIEELKEIIVNLNVSVLHLTNQLEAKEEELEQYHQVLEAKPAVLVGTKYNYFIERALGATLPPDGGLTLSIDEVMKIENEFKECVNWIEQLEQSLKQSASEIENEKAVSANYKALWEEAAHENETLKREMECRDKKIQDLEEAMTVAEKDVVGDERSETKPLTAKPDGYEKVREAFSKFRDDSHNVSKLLFPGKCPNIARVLGCNIFSARGWTMFNEQEMCRLEIILGKLIEANDNTIPEI